MNNTTNFTPFSNGISRIVVTEAIPVRAQIHVWEHIYPDLERFQNGNVYNRFGEPAFMHVVPVEPTQMVKLSNLRLRTPGGRVSDRRTYLRAMIAVASNCAETYEIKKAEETVAYLEKVQLQLTNGEKIDPEEFAAVNSKNPKNLVHVKERLDMNLIAKAGDRIVSGLHIHTTSRSRLGQREIGTISSDCWNGRRFLEIIDFPVYENGEVVKLVSGVLENPGVRDGIFALTFKRDLNVAPLVSDSEDWDTSLQYCYHDLLQWLAEGEGFSGKIGFSRNYDTGNPNWWLVSAARHMIEHFGMTRAEVLAAKEEARQKRFLKEKDRAAVHIAQQRGEIPVTKSVADPKTGEITGWMLADQSGQPSSFGLTINGRIVRVSSVEDVIGDLSQVTFELYRGLSNRKIGSITIHRGTSLQRLLELKNYRLVSEDKAGSLSDVEI